MPYVPQSLAARARSARGGVDGGVGAMTDDSDDSPPSTGVHQPRKNPAPLRARRRQQRLGGWGAGAREVSAAHRRLAEGGRFGGRGAWQAANRQCRFHFHTASPYSDLRTVPRTTGRSGSALRI
jgi:hypothetical protein